LLEYALRRPVCIALGLGLLAAPIAPAYAESSGPVAEQPPKWSAWTEFGGVVSSDNTGRGEMALFAPLMQNANTLLFADCRGKFFEDDVQEGNFALGHRRMLPSGWNIGAWAGYDVRATEEGNSFH
jgi:hypothetical protein